MTDDDRNRTLLIVGFGNPLMGDDGIGPAVVRHLSRLELPASVACRELSDILHLPAVWSEQQGVWMIDAVIGGEPPGTIHRFAHSDVLSLTHRAATVHHLGLTEGLLWMLHAHPEMARVRFDLWGVEPETVSPIEALSEIVDKTVRCLVKELSVAIHDRYDYSVATDS